MQEGEDRIYLRLDRAFATTEWINHLGNSRVHHLVEPTSDHCVLMIADIAPPSQPRQPCLHFEALWTKKDDCREVIELVWSSGSITDTPEGIASCLQRCVANLACWNKEVMGNIPWKIREKKKSLTSLTTHDHDGNLGANINRLRKEINDLLDSEETLWHQRSKIHWYREGDRNTKFFHALASKRRKKNTILSLWG